MCVYISACSGETYGVNCELECTCISVNTENCDSVNGQCTCKAGWTGENCTDDIDECDSNTTCEDVLQTCVNTDGSFTCECVDGYTGTKLRTCEGMSVVISVKVKLL